MKESLYHATTDLMEALRLLGDHGEQAVVLAGGTDLVPRINTYSLKPDVLVYIGKLGLDYIKEKNGKICIGATTPIAKIITSELLIQKVSALVAAAKQVGSAAVRTTATVGGNLANASPAADLATPLLVCDAEVSLMSATGKRAVPLKDFFKGPGQSVLQPGELLTEISFVPPQGKTVFLKLGRRKAMTLSVVNVAVRMNLEGQKCKEARIALGAVASTPLRCEKAEAMVQEKEIDRNLITDCAAQAMAAGSPIDDQRATSWYRKQAGTALVARALSQAADLKAQ
jgi:CO/xanthine dehydrogenase FAD-binding subunit